MSNDAANTAAFGPTFTPWGNRMLQLYAGLIEGYPTRDREEWTQWDRVISGIEIEWDLLAGKLSAAAAAMIQTPETSATLK